MTAEPRLSVRLRDETRDEHDAIERVLDWERRVATVTTYREWLERLWRFHQAWEPAVAAALGADAFAPHGRIAVLEADLARLGSAEVLLPFPEAIAFACPAEALGSLYVIEGSMLGGQLIARRAETTLGFRPAYHGAGGSGWRAFQRRLDAVPLTEHDQAVGAARETFVMLGAWLAG